MFLIIGLGNPGKIYQNTRHNVGKLAVKHWQEVIGFPDFKFQKIFNAFVSRGIFKQKSVALALPETFMNNSGKVVKVLTKTYQVKPGDLIIVHDDIDLPLGKIRIVKNRGGAGHKGIESVIRELKTKNFVRFRIGIRPPEIKKVRNVEGFVLQKFSKRERETVEIAIQKTVEAIETVLREGLGKAMGKYN